MRKKMALFLSLVLFTTVFTVFGQANATVLAQDNKFKAGQYKGSAKGFYGEVTATVTLSETKIVDIVIDASSETPNIGGAAAEALSSEILETQSLAVDAISGATVSSNAVIAAVEGALKKAGANIAVLKDPKNKLAVETGEQQDLNVDVVVIGAGGAGMSAAVEISQAGKSVVILEKMPSIGGNTNRATGGINAAETKLQEENGIDDLKVTFYQDTMKGGYNKNNPELLRIMVDNAAAAVEWLNDLGAGIARVGLSGGATNPRIHTVADGSAVGPVVVNVLAEKLQALNVDILLNTRATKMVKEGDAIVGVEAVNKEGKPFTVHAKAVVLATGGFGANSEMVESYREDLKGFSTTNQPGADGSGIQMALEVGADLTDIGEIQIHPTTHPGTGYMFTEGLRGDGAILVNKGGQRFTNELLTRDVVSQNILKQSGGIAYLIVDEALREDNAALAGYIKNGYAVKGNTLEALAKEISADGATLVETLKKYNESVKNGKDEEFGRDNLKVLLEKGPYYALRVTPGIHHTMGGVKIDTCTHVIDIDGNPITGLYAAGEVTGGVHGGNRIGGNAVADIIVFGRIAGMMSVAEMK